MGPRTLLLQERGRRHIAVTVGVLRPDIILAVLPIEGAQIPAIDPSPVLRPPKEIGGVPAPKVPRTGELRLQLATRLARYDMKGGKLIAPIRAPHHQHPILPGRRERRVA